MKTRPRLVVISGPVGSGKSTLARRLVNRYGAFYIRTQDLMRARAVAYDEELPLERRALQEYGEQLDIDTGGGWVAEGVAKLLDQRDESIDGHGLIVVDSVRARHQVERLREAYGARVTHIHLNAPESVLGERYAERGDASGLVELDSYTEVAQNKTESAVGQLEAEADISIDTQRNLPGDVETRAAAALGLYASRTDKLVDVLIGAQYGSEGKGNIAFYLAPEYDVLVRVGGPERWPQGTAADPVHTPAIAVRHAS